MSATRWSFPAVLLAVVVAACSNPDDEVASRQQPDPQVAAWAVGADVGMHFGPYPTTDAPGSEWFAVVLPESDPIDSFYALMEDAAAQGFETGAAREGPCQHYWQRDEVPIGENGEGDGFDFQGQAPFGEPLPTGAAVVAIDCQGTAAGGGEHVAISVHVPLQVGTATVPLRRPPILLLAQAAEEPTAAFRRVDVDLRLPEYSSGPLTAEEIRGSTLDELAPLVPLGEALMPNGHGGCLGAVLRSSSPPAAAVDAVVEQSMWRESFVDPVSELGVAGQSAAVRHGFTGGALFFATAVETSSGSDVFICSIDN